MSLEDQMHADYAEGRVEKYMPLVTKKQNGMSTCITLSQLDALVVWIKVEDKGVAIKLKDMVENHLFSISVCDDVNLLIGSCLGLSHMCKRK